MKKLSLIVVLLIAIAGIGLWLLVANLDSIVKRVVEDVGSDILDTRVTLNSAAISLGDASAALRGLTIANPAGFETSKNAFELGTIEVSLDPESISTDVLVLQTVIIDQPALFFEQRGNRNNLQALLDNLQGDVQSAGEADEDDGEENRLVIREFRFLGAGITLSHDQLGSDINLKLSDIVLRDIGSVDAAVTAEQAARQIIEPILRKARDAAEDRAREELEALAKKEFDKQKDKAIDSLRDKLFSN